MGRPGAVRYTARCAVKTCWVWVPVSLVQVGPQKNNTEELRASDRVTFALRLSASRGATETRMGLSAPRPLETRA
eukprot:4431751-Pyramimonas_sp.AAC.1